MVGETTINCCKESIHCVFLDLSYNCFALKLSMGQWEFQPPPPQWAYQGICDSLGTVRIHTHPPVNVWIQFHPSTCSSSIFLMSEQCQNVLYQKAPVRVTCIVSQTSVRITCIVSQTSVRIPCMVSQTSVRIPLYAQTSPQWVSHWQEHIMLVVFGKISNFIVPKLTLKYNKQPLWNSYHDSSTPWKNTN